MTEAPTGQAIRLGPLVDRVLAPNPSPYTYTGTQTHLVGARQVAVIDPGPDEAAHLAALLDVINEREVVAIVCTHTHRDHSPLSRALKAATGAPIIGCAPLALDDPATRSDAAFDFDYLPDRVLDEGEVIEGDGWTLEAIATPGHTSNHLAFAMRETDALFTGDHVMGWSTSIVSPPDGDMGAYMASLQKLTERNDAAYYPGHGEAVTDNPQRLARSMLGHRKQREGQIIRLLAAAPATVADMTARMYVGIDPRLLPAAERSVLAHLIDLERRRMVAREGKIWRAR